MLYSHIRTGPCLSHSSAASDAMGSEMREHVYRLAVQGRIWDTVTSLLLSQPLGYPEESEEQGEDKEAKRRRQGQWEEEREVWGSGGRAEAVQSLLRKCRDNAVAFSPWTQFLLLSRGLWEPRDRYAAVYGHHFEDGDGSCDSGEAQISGAVQEGKVGNELRMRLELLDLVLACSGEVVERTQTRTEGQELIVIVKRLLEAHALFCRSCDAVGAPFPLEVHRVSLVALDSVREALSGGPVDKGRAGHVDIDGDSNGDSDGDVDARLWRVVEEGWQRVLDLAMSEERRRRLRALQTPKAPFVTEKAL